MTADTTASPDAIVIQERPFPRQSRWLRSNLRRNSNPLATAVSGAQGKAQTKA
jgi:hypothetical protein